MKRLAVCLGLALPLAAAGAASAKEVVAAKICGASDCRIVNDRAALRALPEGGTPTNPPGPAPHYRVRLTVMAERKCVTFSTVFVPAAGMVRAGTEAEGYIWTQLSDRAARTYGRLARGLEPLPARKLEGLDGPRAGEARVDEVVLPPAPADGGGAGTPAPVWPWLAGPLAALGLVVAVRRRGRRRR